MKQRVRCKRGLSRGVFWFIPPRHKTMRLKAVQIRVLLGKGGETIRNICADPKSAESCGSELIVWALAR